MPLKNSKRQQQTKLKPSRQDIIKIKVETNGIETKKTTQRIESEILRASSLRVKDLQTLGPINQKK
jgi:Ran GTPase-activating protein (RanGAP) involved in mRNA processing and transport